DFAIALGVGVDVAADAVGQRFAEIVVDAVFAAEHHDFAERVRVHARAVGRAVHGTGLAADAKPAVGLGFGDAISSRQQAGEFVAALVVGGGRFTGRDPRVAVPTQQRQLHAADPFFAAFAIVVEVAIVEHVAGERDRQRNLRERKDGAGGAVR